MVKRKKMVKRWEVVNEINETKIEIRNREEKMV